MYYEEIKCVHTAIVDTNTIDSTLDNGIKNKYISDAEDTERLSIKSSEDDESFNAYITPEEKYLALNSWVEGLSELGENALKLQDSIEKAGNIVYSISFRLLMFLAHADVEYILDYINTIKDNCIFEGKLHDPCLIANLTPILEMVIYNTEHRLHYFHANYTIDSEEIIKRVFSLHPPRELLTKNIELMHLLEHPNAINLRNFDNCFKDKDSAIRMAVINNPNATNFDEYKYFLSYKTEKVDSIRMMVANKKESLRFEEYKDLFDEKIEPNAKIRKLAKSNFLQYEEKQKKN